LYSPPPLNHNLNFHSDQPSIALSPLHNTTTTTATLHPCISLTNTILRGVANFARKIFLNSHLSPLFILEEEFSIQFANTN
jgi:hypothetical protein